MKRTKMSPSQKLTKTEENKLIKIATECILELEGREDLEAHNSDSEDFFETSVWALKEALFAAYNLGKKAGEKGREK